MGDYWSRFQLIWTWEETTCMCYDGRSQQAGGVKKKRSSHAAQSRFIRVWWCWWWWCHQKSHWWTGWMRVTDSWDVHWHEGAHCLYSSLVEIQVEPMTFVVSAHISCLSTHWLLQCKWAESETFVFKQNWTHMASVWWSPEYTRWMKLLLLVPSAGAAPLPVTLSVCLLRASFILRRVFFKKGKEKKKDTLPHMTQWIKDMKPVCLVTLGHGEIKTTEWGGKGTEIKARSRKPKKVRGKILEVVFRGLLARLGPLGHCMSHL